MRVVEAMKEERLPDNVELLDGGTAALDLLDELVERDKVIIIDAVKGDNEPGAIYRFTHKDIATQRDSFTSLHQIGLFETLKMAEYLGSAPPEIVIIGIEPEKIEWGLGLSPEVAAIVPKVIELVMGEL